MPDPSSLFKKSAVWKLKSYAVGLNDAYCTWYLRVHDELIKFGIRAFVI